MDPRKKKKKHLDHAAARELSSGPKSFVAPIHPSMDDDDAGNATDAAPDYDDDSDDTTAPVASGS